MQGVVLEIAHEGVHLGHAAVSYTHLLFINAVLLRLCGSQDNDFIPLFPDVYKRQSNNYLSYYNKSLRCFQYETAILSVI